MKGLEGAISGAAKAVRSAVGPKMVAEAAAGSTARAIPEAARAAGVVGGAVETSVRPVEGVLLNTSKQAGGIHATLESISKGEFAPVKIPRESINVSGESTRIKAEGVENPVYQSLKNEAAGRADQQIGQESVAGYEMNDSVKSEIRENELDHAAMQFATQHTEEARAVADKDPRLKAAVESVDKRIAETQSSPLSEQNQTEAKPGPSREDADEVGAQEPEAVSEEPAEGVETEEVQALREQVDKLSSDLVALKSEHENLITDLATFKKEILEAVKKLTDVVKEEDPKKKESLLKIVLEMLAHMAFATVVETPKIAVGQVKDQATS